MDKKFEYHEKWKNPKTGRYIGHVYTLDNKPLRGITSVLKIIAKDNLIQWAADMAVEHLGWKNPKKFSEEECENHLASIYNGLESMDRDTYLQLLTEARTAHITKRDKGADLGTIAHKMVELYVNRKINGTTEAITLSDALREVSEDGKEVTLTEQDKKDVLEMFTHFKNWAEDPLNEVQFLASEKKMYSEKYWIAGTCDLILMYKGKKYIGDVKTMDTLWDRTPFLQANGGYRIMLEELGEKDFAGALIIKIAKPQKVRESQSTKYPIVPFETFESLDYDTDKKGFLAALQLTEVMETYQK